MKINTSIGVFVSVASAMTALLLISQRVSLLSVDEQLVVFIAGLAIILVTALMTYYCGGVEGLNNFGFVGSALLVLFVFSVVFFYGLEKDWGQKLSPAWSLLLVSGMVLVAILYIGPESRFGVLGKFASVWVSGGVLYGLAKLIG